MIFALVKSGRFILQLFRQLRTRCEYSRTALDQEQKMQSFAGREIDFPGLNKNLKTRSNLYSRRSLWVEILYRRQRRPRGGIFRRAEKLLFSAGLHVFFVSRVQSERNATKCAFGRHDSCRYSREPIFQSSSEGLSKGSFKYRSLHLLCILSNFKERKRSKKSAQIHLPCLFVVSYGERGGQKSCDFMKFSTL